jgi:hypothetical protein
MGGNSKISVRDKHFVIRWSAADEQKINRYTERLVSLYSAGRAAAAAATEYTQLADIMLDLIERKENDHHSATAELGHDWLKVDPIDTAIGEDMVTMQGLNKLLKIYLGTASGVFKWVGRGTAAGTPTPYSTALTTETGSRQDSTTTGFQDIKGCSLRVFSTYASTVATATMHQVGIFDASTTGIMLAIHDFGGNGFTHTINVDGFSLGIVIDMVAFGDV